MNSSNQRGSIARILLRFISKPTIAGIAVVLFLLGICVSLPFLLSPPVETQAAAVGADAVCEHCLTTGGAASQIASLGFFGWLFDTSNYPERWNCGTWTASVGWLHILSDVAIWGAYITIPCVLAVFALKRKSPLPGITWLFVAFIAFCGIGHLLEAVIFWHPVYNLAGIWKSMTAAVSLVTAAALVPVIPKVLRWPTLADINKRLRREVHQRRASEQEAQEANKLLAIQSEAVNDANSQLHQKNTELEQILYAVSHDLKAPMVTILGYVNILGNTMKNGDEEECDEMLGRIERAAERMRLHVEDLLEISRLGHVDKESQTIELKNQLELVLDGLSTTIAEKQIEIKTDFQVPTVFANERHISQLLQNLVSNALKYGCDDKHSAIQVGSFEDENFVTIYVRDNGPGIRPEYRERIFGLFERLSNDPLSTGIGLAIVKRIAELYCGRAWVESELGEGATFYVSLKQIPEATDSAASAANTKEQIA